MYTGEAISDNEDLFDLFFVVDKYELPAILKMVEEKFIKNLSIDNVLKTYEFFDCMQKPEMKKNIFKFIMKNTMLVLQCQSLLQIQRSTLRLLLLLLFSNAAEIQLFNACLRWAKAECARNGIIDPAPVELRNALGSELFLILIPTMSVQHFMQGPVASGMFDKEEQNELLDYILAPIESKIKSNFVLRFNTIKRRISGKIVLFFEHKFNFIQAKYSTMEAISTFQFKASDDFLLAGFGFGRLIDKFTVTSVVLLENGLQICRKENVSYVSSEGKDSKNPKSCRIIFDSPFLISAGSTYNLTICLEFDEIRYFNYKIKKEMFEIKYKKNFFEKNPISIECLNKTQSAVCISQLIIY